MLYMASLIQEQSDLKTTKFRLSGQKACGFFKEFLMSSENPGVHGNPVAGVDLVIGVGAKGTQRSYVGVSAARGKAAN